MARAKPEQVPEAVKAALAQHVPPRARLAVALSGGRDSVALLDAVLAVAPERALDVVAVHVHHGLSTHADEWAAFCAELCASHAVPLQVRHVDVLRGPRKSVEAEARRARYAALAAAAASADVRTIALAHHQDDQAETVLLQLLRGAGTQGLAAMPSARTDAAGIVWLRPLLDVSRNAIDDYVNVRGLRFVDDDSNADVRYARNALRERVIPALGTVAAGYPGTVARAALHQAEAAALADDLAAIDAGSDRGDPTLARDLLRMLPPHRARNLLRWFLRERGLPPPSAARLVAMHRQLRDARPDAHVRLPHAGAEIGIHRGRIIVHRPLAAPFERRWNGEAALAFPHGTLEFALRRGTGIAAARLATHPVIVRSRRGGEQIQIDAGRGPRALKALLHAAGIPEWTRMGLPLVFCGESLAAVPRIGVDCQFAAAAGNDGYELVWTEG
jgi:tRNA(Ile)-lysidine synthase